jgi:hypothetical protein
VSRPISEIAREIRAAWQPPGKIYFGAVPYLEAMGNLQRITDSYGADDAKSIVLYFLSNAASFRGPDARRLKAELKALVK